MQTPRITSVENFAAAALGRLQDDSNGNEADLEQVNREKGDAFLGQIETQGTPGLEQQFASKSRQAAATSGSDVGACIVHYRSLQMMAGGNLKAAAAAVPGPLAVSLAALGQSTVQNIVTMGAQPADARKIGGQLLTSIGQSAPSETQSALVSGITAATSAPGVSDINAVNVQKLGFTLLMTQQIDSRSASLGADEWLSVFGSGALGVDRAADARLMGDAVLQHLAENAQSPAHRETARQALEKSRDTTDEVAVGLHKQTFNRMLTEESQS